MKFSLSALYAWYRQALRHPRYRWWVILGTCLYLFSPIDISPDLFPFLGQIDDAAVLTLLVAELWQILQERLRSPAAKTVPSPESSTRQPSPSADTVDVDAVSVD